MHLARLDIAGFKSFAKKTSFDFTTTVTGIVGPNGSGKSNVAEAIRFVLGEQSMKSMRGKRGEDLIWNGSTSSPRANRGSVAIVFNNTPRFLDIDFDEVTVERVVNRDGTNEYRLNGSVVRLKDVLGLLASANIGASGHHIVSQGEADKILSSSPKDRREMLEDALGLKVFQYKKDESIRKLEKTEENMRQVEALRREVAPHLKFLKRQVDKVEKANALKAEALSRFQAYFASEEARLKVARAEIGAVRTRAEADLAKVMKAIKEAEHVLAKSGEAAAGTRITELSRALDAARARRADAARRAARLDGELAALVRASAKASVSRDDLSRLLGEAEAEFIASQSTLESVIAFVTRFFKRLKDLSSQGAGSADLATLTKEKSAAEAEEAAAAEEEQKLDADLIALRRELDESRVEEREKERSLYDLATKERDLKHTLERMISDVERLSLEEDELKRDIAEAIPLIGREVADYKNMKVSGDVRTSDVRMQERRELEKVKIRLEESLLAGGDEIMKEYHDASEREAFLEKELADLTASSASLKTLIADLDAELGSRFKDGLTAVNVEFTRLFGILFDGGTASLVATKELPRGSVNLEDENDDGIPDTLEKPVEGIEVALSIPRKRVKSLTMLSGGERALTSIALIFAMSSVNPPPFLVLDETDAALDEANSRRYGDMVATLAEKSQLIVITHNRETMSRAGILYGVTMGGDGVSKVLSVKLEEAVKVAK